MLKSERPLVVIHSGDPSSDRQLRDGLLSAFPELTLRTAHGEAEIRRNLPDAEVLVAWNFPYELLAAAPRLRWLQVLGAGVDSLHGLQLRKGIAVTNIRGVFGAEMAEYVLAYLLAHAKGLASYRRLQHEHRWEPSEPAMLQGKTIGVAGLGSIGRVIAERCSALGMEVVGLKRTPGEVAGVARVYTIGEIDDFLGRLDFLVLVLPATGETTRLLTRERFRAMKTSSFVVSVGRGNVMDESDLVDALRSGEIAGAALDVFPTEPLPDDSPLWDMEQVYVTPHVSGMNRPRDLLPALRENLGRYLKGEELLNRVDLERGY